MTSDRTPHDDAPQAAPSVAGGLRGVRVGLGVGVLQTAVLAATAWSTGSSALVTQTATSLADVAGSIFLVIGVVSGERPADHSHPLGYGRERFFWSFLAAVGVFVGGFGAALAETAHALLHPETAAHFLLGYAVLAVLVVTDAAALAVGVGPLLARARRRHLPLSRLVWRGTDPAATTVVLTSAAGVAGGLLAAAGLAGSQVTGRALPDTVAGAAIGLILLATSVVLLHTNRELLTGRGVPLALTAAMRAVVLRQRGVLAVPDLFAIVVGPATLIVNGDVVFEDALDVPAVESAIVSAATALRDSWPAVAYVYLNPVAARRHRRRSAGSRSVTPAGRRGT